MFCTNCGKEIPEKSTFCTECGHPVSAHKKEAEKRTGNLDDKWWLRLAKVVYIALYIPLPFVLIGVWTSSDPYTYYSSYSREYITYGSYGEAFWYSLLTLVVWVVVLRLIKITFLYISFAQKPQWKKEFRKFF